MEILIIVFEKLNKYRGMGDFMRGNFDFKGNKGFRMIYIFERLSNGELVKKANLAEELCVSEKSIQRDIQDLRMYLAETRFYEEEIKINYDKTRKGYHLNKREKERFTNKEILVLSKILLESRVFRKNEIETLLKKLLVQTSPIEKRKLEAVIKYNKMEPVNENKFDLMDLIWELSTFILDKKLISFTYIQDGERKELNEIKPISIIFSDDYFFLTAVQDGNATTLENYQIDKIKNIKLT